MTATRWFPGATLNFAENLLRPSDLADPTFAATPAVIFRSEIGIEQWLTRSELYSRATAFAVFLRSRGVEAGDRVAAVLPNVPEAVVAMLGTAAIGAIWSSCSPDFGEDAIADRFGQVDPKVLVTTTKASYNGKPVAVFDKVRGVRPRLPGVRTCVVAGELPTAIGTEWISFEQAVATPTGAFAFDRFSFDHPLYILFSSGTTGPPKCITHGAGGTHLQH
jgi:acetoacetyl-CoA synthetase